MILVRATQKLLNTQRLKPQTVDLSAIKLPILGTWYANTVTSSFKGKSLVIYVHEPSLVTVVTVGKTIKKTFPNFIISLEKLLKRFSFPTVFINEQMAYFKENAITKTDSRKMLGYMNSITDSLIGRMYTYQNFEEIDLEEEENILMNQLHGSTPSNFFRPINYWENYLKGEDPFKQNIDSENELIQLIPDVNKLSRSEDLHMENQLMKLQLENILGGQIMNGSNEGIPAEIENLFLKNIIEFEKQVTTSTKVTVNDLLKNPKFKAADSLNEKQLKSELKKINLLLNKKFIQLDFLDNYSDLVKYKFITEELINQETQTLNIPGMITHFIYEEFHPNHEFDVKNKIKHFIYTMLDEEELDSSNFKYTCSDEILLNKQSTSLKELEEKVKYFHLIHNAEEVMDYRKKELLFNKNYTKAKVFGTLEFKKPGTKTKTKYDMNFELKNNESLWEIISIDFELLN